MFETLTPTAPDAILSLMAAFRADSRSQKIDLGVGVYQDDQGNTPVMAAVKAAEQYLLDEETTKTYQGIPGDTEFNALNIALVLGADHQVIRDNRVRSLATPGGSGALRLGAEVVRRANPKAKLWVGVPTWPNHIPLLGTAGFEIVEYSYYDTEKRALDFDAMRTALSQVPAGDIVLLHGCCHNPTGADLSHEQWHEVLAMAQQQSFIPFVDTAYQGLGDGIDADAYGLRLLANNLPEMVVASSCSKNFGLYRERTGLVAFIANNPQQADVVASQASTVARQIWSMPPAHGERVVARILGDQQLKNDWLNELGEVRQRIQLMRTLLVDSIKDNAAGMDFSHIVAQKGMFSFLGITPSQLEQLREEYAIYIVGSTRINLAGINSNNIDYLAESIKAVLR